MLFSLLTLMILLESLARYRYEADCKSKRKPSFSKYFYEKLYFNAPKMLSATEPIHLIKMWVYCVSKRLSAFIIPWWILGKTLLFLISKSVYIDVSLQYNAVLNTALWLYRTVSTHALLTVWQTLRDFSKTAIATAVKSIKYLLTGYNLHILHAGTR